LIQDPGTRSEIVYRAGLLLVCSNVLMTFAWYAHLRNPGAVYFGFRGAA
jgi:uncharacterized protein (DUF486 family)